MNSALSLRLATKLPIFLQNANLRVNLLLIGPTLAIVFLILITVTL